MPSTRSSATSEAPAPASPRRGRLVGVVALVVVLVLGTLAVVLVTSGGDDAPSSSENTRHPTITFVGDGSAEVGEPAPDFTLPGLDGGRVDLAGSRGKGVILNFWASWCNPCRKEFPLLAKARARHGADELEVIGVSYRDIAADARAFASSRDADWPLARDPDGRLAAAYGVRAIPQTYFIAPDGTITARVFGITSAKDLEAEIDAILPRSDG